MVSVFNIWNSTEIYVKTKIWRIRRNKLKGEKMWEKFAKLKDENKILVMLAFFSISKGLWENFRQLWLQDNMLNVTQISEILSVASLCCVIVLIILAKRYH